MKKNMVIACPIKSRSGYGQWSRQIVKLIIDKYQQEYNIAVIDADIGNKFASNVFDTYRQFEPDSEYLIIENYIKSDKEIFDKIFINTWIQISAAQAFQRLGQFNIGISACAQVAPVHPQIIEGCNRMDVVYTMSEFNIEGLKTSKFNMPNGTIVELTKDVHKLISGVNPKYLNYYDKKLDIVKYIDETIKQDFCYLFVGDWLPGSLGNDRKDIGNLIRIFTGTFKGNKDVALVLKLSLGNPSTISQYQIQSRITEIRNMITPNEDEQPSVYLIFGQLTNNELYTLYNHNKIKSYVTFTHGQSYGMPIAEFSGYTGKPVIVPYFSAPVDYLNSKYNIFLNGKLTQIPQQLLSVEMYNTYLIPQSKWFTVDYNNASYMLADVYNRYNHYLQLSKQQQEWIMSNCNINAMIDQFVNPYQKYLSQNKKLDLDQFDLL